MSLRPRYSLLTLLILTALVAGGVKLWRGPHHVVVSGETRTAEERRLFTKFPNNFSSSRYNAYGAFRYEYSYLQHWSERQYVWIRMFPASDKRPLLVRANQTIFHLMPDPYLQDLSKYPEVDPNDLEYLHHVCYLPQSPEHLKRAVEGDPFSNLLPPLNDTDVYPSYFISTKGHVYKSTLSNIVLSVVRTDLTTLPPNVREALEIEIVAATKQ